MIKNLLPRSIILLLARIFLSLLFILMGWSKLTGFPSTVAYFASTGVPLPHFAAIIAVLVELGLGIFILLGILTTSSAILLSVYTIVTAFIGHHYWTFSGMQRYDMWIHFYKNIGVAGGFIALAVNGPGRLSVDSILSSRK